MKRLVLATTLLLTTFAVKAQQYWQQEVNYNISVKLDDKTHFLRGYESFEYINNSPNTLDVIYIHLWANAYKNDETALAKQNYAAGNQLLKYGNDSIKGFVDSLDFTVGGVKVELTYDEKNPDIAKIVLPKPLASGDKVTITTPFRVKLPSGAISRMGHVGQSYQITQWYPKPAVYDKNGWNPIPYLNQGEFYSEYGSYDVSITLPKNYVIGSTGDCQTASEVDYMNSLVGKSSVERGLPSTYGDFPASSSEWKTVRYTQSKVHDFAWFADKRYLVLKGEVALPASGRKVTSWALFTPQNAKVWADAIEYINDGTYYYSKWNGDYPYNHVTAVDGTISAGSGMEYPNVTIIGTTGNKEALEVVIVHEVGHNWFYGILGSNERVHGWMDEGMNTLNEMRYIDTKYPGNTRLSDMVLDGAFHFDGLGNYHQNDLTYRVVAGLGEDQPMETSSPDFSQINYAGIMYGKTGLVFHYLKEYLGDVEFDRCMHAYYEEWKFKHPQPEDMKATLERASGKNLDWLFVDIIPTTNHIDYKVKKVKVDETGTGVTVKNVGQVNGPIEVSIYKDGKLIETKWAEPSDEKSKVTFGTQADEVRINASGHIPEWNRSNNGWKKAGLFGKVEKPKMEFLIGDNEANSSNNFWTPFIGANVYDNFMIGAAFHNSGIPFKPFQYLAVPMYSFGRGSVSGMADITYTFLPSKGLKSSRFGIAVRSFKESDTLREKNDGYYVTVSPFWLAKIGNRKAATPVSQTILLQTMYRLDVYGPSQTELVGGFIKYDFNFNQPDHEVNVGLRTDYVTNPVNGDQFGRVSAEATYRLRYMPKKKRWLELRGYAGSNYLFDMLNTPNPMNYSLSLSGASGAQDIFTEDYFFGRNETTGFWSQQRLENMGGFKSTSGYGTTTSWIASTNFFMQLPFGPKVVGIFADAGWFPNSISGKVVSAFDVGAGLRLSKIFGLYFPVYMSKDMDASYGTLGYGSKIRFTLRMSITNRPINLRSLIK